MASCGLNAFIKFISIHPLYFHTPSVILPERLQPRASPLDPMHLQCVDGGVRRHFAREQIREVSLCVSRSGSGGREAEVFADACVELCVV